MKKIQNNQNDNKENEDKKERLYVKVTAKKVYRQKLILRILSIFTGAAMLFLSISYLILYIINETGNFTITLDPNLNKTSEIEISPYNDFSYISNTLNAKSLEYMDNISGSWLPDDLHTKDGEQSKDNYIAYSFYVRNKSQEEVKYMTTIDVVSVIKNVDEAVRVRVYYNDEVTTYAKVNKNTNKEELNTKRFISSTQVMQKKIEGLKPGAQDKFTVVIWLEGDDPDCIDDILGGELKLRMFITQSLE